MTNCIQVGFDENKKQVWYELNGEKIVHAEYVPLKTGSDAVDFLRQSRFGIIHTYHSKEANSKFVEVTGLKPTTFKRIWNKCMRKVWIEPIEKYYSKYCFSNKTKMEKGDVVTYKKIQPLKLRAIHNSIDLVEQCDKDGLANIIPLVITFNKSPKELKQLFGKSSWKKLCKNSHERNRLLCKPLMSSFIDDRSTINSIKNRMEYPSTVLRRGFNFRSIEMTREEMDYLKDNVGVTYKQIADGEAETYYHTIRDTKAMAEQLGRSFNKNWSYETVKKRHEEYSEEIMLQKDRLLKTPFNYLDALPFLDFKEDGIKAELLTTKFSIRNEGKTMHHCVAMYAESCMNSTYSVWSIVDGDDQRYTLGCNMNDHTKKLLFNQCFGVCNKRAPEKVIKFCDKLICNFNGEIDCYEIS